MPEFGINLPCGRITGPVWTKCYHCNSCASASECPIAVPGTGGKQYCQSPLVSFIPPNVKTFQENNAGLLVGKAAQ